MRWIWPVLTMVLAASWPAFVQAKIVKPTDAVAGHPSLTYLDLAKQAVPSLAPTDAGDIEGHLKDPPPRHIAGKDFEGDPPDPVTLGWMEDMRILAGGQKRMVILADLGPDPDRAYSQTLLLLFDDGPHPKLLDVVDVGIDKDTVFDDKPTLKLGPGDDALITISEHDDSDLAYDGRILLFVRGDKFRFIADFYVITENGCGWTQKQPAAFTTRPDPGSPYNSIDIVVRHRVRHTEDDGCDAVPKAVSRTFEALYRWNAKLGRFTTTSDGLKRLGKLNGMGP